MVGSTVSSRTSRSLKEGATLGSRPRLLFVDNRPEYFTTHRLALARAAVEAGYDVHVTTLTAGSTVEIRRAGLTYSFIAREGRDSNPFAEMALIVRLVRLLEELQPHVVHAVTLRAMLYGGLAARFAGVPALVHSVTGLGYLFSSESWRARILKEIVVQLLRPALCHPHQAVIFQNRDDRALFDKRELVEEAGSTLIKGSGVDLDAFPEAPVQTSGESITVLMPARMLWHKGVGTFVEAAREVRLSREDVRFVLAGAVDPDNPGSVPNSQLEAWEREGVVEWHGYVEDMPAAFADADVVCLPSNYREGVPKALIEAAATGRPLVATDAPGCREIVQDGVNGLLVPPQDADALASAVRSLLDAPQRREQMGRAGRSIVRQEFSLEKVISATLRCYEALRAPSIS